MISWLVSFGNYSLVNINFLEQYTVKNVGSTMWVPAEEPDEFNRHIAGLIEIVESYGG